MKKKEKKREKKEEKKNKEKKKKSYSRWFINLCQLQLVTYLRFWFLKKWPQKSR